MERFSVHLILGSVGVTFFRAWFWVWLGGSSGKAGDDTSGLSGKEVNKGLNLFLAKIVN